MYVCIYLYMYLYVCIYRRHIISFMKMSVKKSRVY